MQSRKRYYVLTKLVSLHPHQSPLLHATGEAKALSNTEYMPILTLFEKLDDAKVYAEETKQEYYHDAFKSAIVEIYMDSRALEKLSKKEEKLSNRYPLKPKDPSKIHTFYTITNEPHNYVTYQFWYKEHQGIALHTEEMEVYNKLSLEKTMPILSSLALFFEKYTKWELGTWRSHKEEAGQLSFMINRCRNEKEVYDAIFAYRQHLLQKTKDQKLNVTGTFMKRIELALKVLRDHAGDALEKQPEHEYKSDLSKKISAAIS